MVAVAHNCHRNSYLLRFRFNIDIERSHRTFIFNCNQNLACFCAVESSNRCVIHRRSGSCTVAPLGSENNTICIKFFARLILCFVCTRDNQLSYIGFCPFFRIAELFFIRSKWVIRSIKVLSAHTSNVRKLPRSVKVNSSTLCLMVFTTRVYIFYKAYAPLCTTINGIVIIANSVAYIHRTHKTDNRADILSTGMNFTSKFVVKNATYTIVPALCNIFSFRTQDTTNRCGTSYFTSNTAVRDDDTRRVWSRTCMVSTTQDASRILF